MTKWLDVDLGPRDWDAVGELPDRRRGLDPRDLGGGWTALVEDLREWA